MDAPSQICIIRVEDIAPGSPYVADTMPTLAKAPRYRSACNKHNMINVMLCYVHVA